MLEFNDITLADKQWVEELFYKANNNSEEFNFTFNYIWRDVFDIKVARFNDFVIIASFRENYPPTFLFPAGSGDVKAAIDEIISYAESEDCKACFHCVLEPHKALLETMYPDKFAFLELEQYFDYVYETESLTTLAGKKLHSKRNHINRFKENNPDWSYEPITADNLPEVIRMNQHWIKLNADDADKTFDEESSSVTKALVDLFSLSVVGGLIRVGGNVVAFSVGEKLNSDTFLVHIEKACSEVQGAYTIINQQFAEHNCHSAGYKYMNREDDSGNEGLRKAKQSYRPVYMVKKYAAKLV